MHWLTRVSLGNRWVTFCVVAIIAILSVIATTRLKTELMPDIEFPMVTVIAQRQGYTPEDMMNQISIPVEEEIKNVSGLKHIESTSQEGFAFIFATFEYGTNISRATEKIETELNQQEELATLMSAGELSVIPISFELIPLVMLSLSSDELTTAELRTVAEELVQEVSVVEGILPPDKETPFMKGVEISGGNEDVLVIPDAATLNDSGIPVSWIIQTLGMTEQYDQVDDIRNTHLLGNPSLPQVQAVATIVDPVATSYADGSPSVTITWRKDPEANTVEVANAVINKVEEFEASPAFPENASIGIIMDESEFIEDSIGDLTRDATIGMILAMLVILVFLWALRPSFIVMISIPLSVLIGFLLMYAFSITINILTLGGMAIAVGRIVDNSIVALENIYRHLQKGEGLRQSCMDGVREVAMPITSATIATVAIFIPLIVVGGLVGELFRPFALTVTFALVASLVIALMVIPPLATFITTRTARFEDEDNWYTRAYTATLRWSLRNRALTLAIAGALFIASLLLPMLGLVGTSFLAAGDPSAITVTIEMPHGNDLDVVAKAHEVESQLDGLNVKSYNTYLGNIMGGGATTGGLATIMIQLQSSSDTEFAAETLRQRVLPLVSEYTSITVTEGEAGAEMMAGDRLELRVIGKEGYGLEQVEEVTQALTAELEKRNDLENLESELVLDLTNPDMTPDPVSIAEQGMDIDQVLGEWYLMRFGWPISELGQSASTVTVGESTAEIYVPSVVTGLSDIDQIRQLRLGTGASTLDDVATVDWGPAAYRRAEGGYAGTIVARVTAGDIGRVNREVLETIDSLGDLPEGVEEISMGGVAEQMMEGFTDMGIAILLAILIVYIVLMVSFRSWLTPVLIMGTMPLASIGAMLGLLFTGRSLGMSALMGILMLVGIVLTNAIVFLTFVEDRRKEGASTHDALMDAGRIRLRPILMTAITTMIALVPLSLGISEGGFIAAELGVVVIGGLFSSTLLTLLVIPVLYSLTERLRRHPHN
ncbi:MAG: efflux RND transporter permease subunit [Chloroflexota bacterium]|nr:efflux RND transporter permease subunit [Chloroflexota bacterium]